MAGQKAGRKVVSLQVMDRLEKQCSSYLKSARIEASLGNEDKAKSLRRQAYELTRRIYRLQQPK